MESPSTVADTAPCEADFDTEKWAQERLEQVVSSKKSVADVLGELRPLIYVENEEKKEKALTMLVTLLLKLPYDILSKEQVELLLTFLCKQLDVAGLAAPTVIQGIRHLALENQNAGPNTAVNLFHNLFQNGNVQAWAVSERLFMYDMLEWLAVKQKEGPFAEEMFETVACYFPVQFKPRADDAITREELSLACSACLLAHVKFAPFCYLLIEEKITEDKETRSELCSLLISAVRAFPAAKLLPHLEHLLGGIRAASFDPTDKDATAVAPAKEAFSEMCKALAQLGPEHYENMMKDMLENIEPFVLQAEMGLAVRAFSLLEAMCPQELQGPESCNEKTAGLVTVIKPTVSKILSWAVMLVQGVTLNTAANREDVARDGLTALVRWVRLACKMGYEDLLLPQENQMLLSVEESRDILPEEASTATYQLAKVFLGMRQSSIIDAGSSIGNGFSKETMRVEETVEEEEREKRYEELVRRGIDHHMKDPELENYLEFVSVFAKKRWKIMSEILSEMNSVQGATQDEMLKRMQILCSVAYNEEKWEELRMGIEILARGLGARGCYQWLQLLRDVKEGRSTVPGEIVAEHFVRYLCSTSDEELQSLCKEQKIGQELGLLIDERDSKRSYIEGLKADLIKGDQAGVEGVKKMLASPEEFPPSSLDALLDFSHVLYDAENNKLKHSLLYRQRILYQLAPLIMESLSTLKNPSARLTLLSHLRHLIRLQSSETGEEAVARVISPFLPVFVESFHEYSTANATTEAENKAEEVALAPFLLESLHGVVKRAEKKELNREVVAKMTDGLSLLIEKDTQKLETVLECVNVLRTLCSAAPPSSNQPAISRVVRALSHAAGHKKRKVRQAAADVRNRWELLSTV